MRPLDQVVNRQLLLRGLGQTAISASTAALVALFTASIAGRLAMLQPFEPRPNKGLALCHGFHAERQEFKLSSRNGHKLPDGRLYLAIDRS